MCQTRILYPEILSFKNEDIIKTFLDLKKLREFVASRNTRNTKESPSGLKASDPG